MALGEAQDDESTLDRRHRVVLWALAISRPQAATLDQIADAMWPGAPPATHDKVIQGSISRLRKTYGKDAIRTVDGSYRLSGSVVIACDRFERQVARAKRLLAVGQADRAAFVLADALDSWTGPPYQELGHWSPAVAEQARLTELTMQAEELHVEAMLAAGKADDALPLARLLATAEPLREPRWLTWAKAAYLTGNQADALRVLRDCRETLRDELGLDPSEDLGTLETAILRQDPALAPPTTSGSSPTCPWRGLQSYEASDAEDFFGRDRDIAHGMRVLDESGVLAVAGPSGIGKSSFVRAGLAAALERRGLRVDVTTPQRGLPGHVADVLVLDQAEELFALPPGAAADVLAGVDAALVVVSIRTDRLSEASRIPPLARLLERGLFLLGGIDAEGLREAVERPAMQSGLVLEPGLVDLMLRDVEGEPAALPMFSHALVETWRRREGRTLTIDGYLSAGGVRGAVAQTAESLYAGLDPSRHPELRSLMLRLVRTTDEGETTRAHVQRQWLTAADDLVDQLVAARLISSDDTSLALTHEALITAWPRLQDWLADDVEGRRQLQHLAQSASTWEAMGRPASELYRGARLDRALAWAATTALELSESEQEFLATGREARGAEQERERRELDRQRRSNRRLRLLASGLAVVLALAVVAGALAIRQQRRAEAQTRALTAAQLQADANRVAALALNTADAQLSLLLAVAAERLAPGVVTDRSLSAALATRPELIATSTTTDPTTPASGLGELASAGSRVYGLDARHVLHVFTTGLRPLDTVDLGNGRIDRDPPRLTAAANLVAAAAGPGQSPAITVLNALSLQPMELRLERLPQNVRVDSLDLSADGRTLSAALQTPHVERLMTWRLPSGRRLGVPIRARRGTVVRVSDDGSRLFTSNPASGYDVTSGRRLWHAPLAAGLDVHDGLVAVSAPDASRVRILDASNGRTLRTLIGNQGPVLDLTFSPNGTSLAATVGNGTATVWDVESGRIVHSLQTGAQRGIAFSDFGDTLFTGGSRLGSLLAWDLQGRRSFLTRVALDGFRPLSQGSVLVSPAGSWVAMSGTVPGRPELTLGGVRPDSGVQVVVPDAPWRGVGAWSPDASRYAYADGGGFLSVVNPADGARLSRRRVTSRPILDVSYAGTDRLVALAGHDELLVADADTLRVQDRVSVPAVGSRVTASDSFAVVTSAASKGGTTWRVPATRWHLVDLEEARVVADGDVEVGSAAVASFSPDATRIAFGGEEEDLAILTMPDGAVVTSTGPGSGERVSSLSWSPDGSRLVASTGPVLRLWDATRGAEIAQVRLPAGEVFSAAGFATDGGITIATPAGNVYRWDPSPQAAVEFACRVAGRDLTLAEWRDAFGDRPARPVCS